MEHHPEITIPLPSGIEFLVQAPFIEMKKYLSAFGGLTILLGILLSSTSVSFAQSDDEAIAVAERVITRLGGQDNWNNTRYIAWTIFGRNHLWDKWTGDYRVEYDTTMVLMNIHTMSGKQLIMDTAVGGAFNNHFSEKETLDNAYSHWVNDSYWLIMPYKLLDPGTQLKYLGANSIDQDGSMLKVEQIELTFENVGLTPQNKYVISVDENDLVVRWDFFSNADDAEARFSRPWTKWSAYGNIWLSTGRSFDLGSGIDVTNLSLPNEVAETAFKKAADTGLFSK